MVEMKKKGKRKKKQLSQKEIDELAKKIGYLILEQAGNLCTKIQKGKISIKKLCIARYMCEEGAKDFKCDPWTEAFECTSAMEEFKCGANGKEFSCKGNWDDFECEKIFDCGSGCGPFKCLVSFDDEDCEGTFTCDTEHFNCDTKKEYNT